MEKFVYILSETLYKSYLKENVYKWLPMVVIDKLVQKLKPRILCSYLDGEIPIGYGVGMLDPRAEESNKQYTNRLLDALSQLEIDDISTVIFEDREHALSINKDVMAYRALPSMRNGTEIDIKFLKDVLERLYKIKGNNLKEKEILVLGEGRHRTKDLIMDLADDVKYLTLCDEKGSFLEKLEEQVLLRTGLVLHTVKETVKDYNKYDVIVNLKSDGLEGYRRIKKRTLLFDMSNKHQFAVDINAKRKDLLCIDAFIYKAPKAISCTIKALNIPDEVYANVYALLQNKRTKGDIVKIRSHNEALTFEAIGKLYSNKGRKVSNFKNKCDD